MNKLLISLAAVPLMSGVAFAGQPLSDRQMDTVTAGFSALSTSEAEAFGGIAAASQSDLAEVAALRNNSGVPVVVTFNEVTLNIIKSVSASQSVSAASNLPVLQGIPVVSP